MSGNVISALIALAIIAAAGAYIVRAVRKGAHAEADSEQKGEILDAIVEHKKVEDAVDALPADDARKRLQQWSPR